MSKVKIKLISIGNLPIDFSLKKVECWQSSIFEIVDHIDKLALRCDSDGNAWQFSDELLKNQLPSSVNADLTMAIVNVPLEDNWYSRILAQNQVVFTFHDVNKILEDQNIPLENIIYRLLYVYSLLYRSSGNKILDTDKNMQFTHDETRGCLFDMNGIKTDLVASCHKPQICHECEERLHKNRVSSYVIENTKKEIKKIQRSLYYQIIGQIKKHPIWTLIISSLFAIFLGVIGSIIGSFAYSFLIK